MTVGEDFGVPVALYAEFTARPGCAEAIRSLLAELTLKVQQEPGNLVFSPYQEKTNQNKFFVYEVYRDTRAFQSHLEADYGFAFNAELNNLIIENASILTHLKPVDLLS